MSLPRSMRMNFLLLLLASFLQGNALGNEPCEVLNHLAVARGAASPAVELADITGKYPVPKTPIVLNSEITSLAAEIGHLETELRALQARHRKKDLTERAKQELEKESLKILLIDKGAMLEAAKMILYAQIPAASVRGYPYGFESLADYRSFSREVFMGLQKVLRQSPGEHLRIFIEGSAVSGLSFAEKGEGDAKGLRRVVGDHSDFDIGAEVSTVTFNRMVNDPRLKALGLETRGGGKRTGPIKGSVQAALGLETISRSLRENWGRPVNFMFYQPNAISETRSVPKMELPN